MSYKIFVFNLLRHVAQKNHRERNDFHHFVVDDEFQFSIQLLYEFAKVFCNINCVNFM